MNLCSKNIKKFRILLRDGPKNLERGIQNCRPRQKSLKTATMHAILPFLENRPTRHN